METLLTPSNITFGLGVLAIMFSVYNSFRNPQINAEKIDALMGQKLGEMEKQMLAFNTSLQAHLASDAVAFGDLNRHIVEVDKSVVKLTTIIDERIPKHGQ